MSATLRQRAPSPVGQGVSEKAALIKEEEIKEAKDGKQFIVPNFTVKQLLDAIPAHCYHRSALKSSTYVARDVIAISFLVYGAYHIDSFLSRFNLSSIAFTAAKVALYTAYTFVTGLFGTGLWIIAHECGHQSYSSSKSINNFVGWVLHSILLVPYHSWRISHGQHHAATGHMTRDQVFVPRTRSQLGHPAIKDDEELQGINVSAFRQAELREAIEDAPIYQFLHMAMHQLLGWPLYLIRNASGQLGYPAYTNHYNPGSHIFRNSKASQIIISDIGVGAVIAGLTYWSIKRSFTEMFIIYGIPYLYVNNWLVFITYLQHTDPVLPHYSAEKWTFARGALATIDRTFMGPVGGWILHGICETHVAHHTSSKIPHYNAWEATDALKKFLGPHYQRSEENMFVSFYKAHRDCIFVEDNEGIVFFKNAAGVAQKYAVEEGGNISDSGVELEPEFKDE